MVLIRDYFVWEVNFDTNLILKLVLDTVLS